MVLNIESDDQTIHLLRFSARAKQKPAQAFAVAGHHVGCSVIGIIRG